MYAPVLVLIHCGCGRNHKHIDTLTIDEWTSVLRLSTMWEITGVRELAITRLTALPVDPVEKVVLARECHVEEWLVPALSHFVQRALPLGKREVDELGIDTVLKLAEIRECCTYLARGQLNNWKLREQRGEVNIDCRDRIMLAFDLGPMHGTSSPNLDAVAEASM